MDSTGLKRRRIGSDELLKRYKNGDRKFRLMDLTGASLIGAQLSESDLVGCDLSRADLSMANLRGADLTNANLSGAKLGGADLRGASLGATNLTRASVTAAYLDGANLATANLSDADLDGSNLNGAILMAADFSNVYLGGVQFDGTEVCKGIRIDTAHGNALFKRFAQDQDYIESYRDQSQWHRRAWYWFWVVTSRCGRSVGRWAGISLGHTARKLIHSPLRK